jgi:cytochrome c biogenesis protein CcdA
MGVFARFQMGKMQGYCGKIKRSIVKRGVKSLFKSFAIQFLIYTGLLIGYFLLVLHFLGNWLNHLFHQERSVYAIVALALIIFQGLVLERLTHFLVFLVGKIKRQRSR